MTNNRKETELNNETLIAKYNSEVASLVHRVLTLQVALEEMQAANAKLQAELADHGKEDKENE